MEGTLSKWTNVMKGWQIRWFVLDEQAGLFSYYTVSNCCVFCVSHYPLDSYQVLVLTALRLAKNFTLEPSTRLQHACAVGTFRAVSPARRRGRVWRHLVQNLSVSYSLKIPAAGGGSGAKQHSSLHVGHLETSLMLKNRTVALCGVFSADFFLAYRLTQNILQYVGWWRFETASDWRGACMMSFRYDVLALFTVQPGFRLRGAEQRSVTWAFPDRSTKIFASRTTFFILRKFCLQGNLVPQSRWHWLTNP